MITRVANAVQKSLRPRLVSAESKRMFSFASKHKLLTKEGQINSDGLILTHLTDFAPSNGIIETAKNAIGWTRNSVHFATNHGVVSHGCGNWTGKKYSVIIPYQKAVKTKGNKIVGGLPADLYSKDSIKIPKGSVIVRYNSKIPKGKFKIIDSSKIEEFKKLKGIKIIDTSEKDMQTATDKVLEKLGYEVRSSHPFVFGKTYDDGYLMLDKFNKFLRQHKMKPMMHSYTPNGRTERLLENIGFRAKYYDDWVVKDKDGSILINYKDKYIDILKNIAKDLKNNKYKSEHDINKIISIIQNSTTPKQAEKSLLKNLKLKTLLTEEGSGNINELSLYQHLGFSSDTSEDVLKIISEYLKNPSRVLFEQIEQAGQKHNLKYISSKQLFDAGAFMQAFQCKENTIANKLQLLI